MLSVRLLVCLGSLRIRPRIARGTVQEKTTRHWKWSVRGRRRCGVRKEAGVGHALVRSGFRADKIVGGMGGADLVQILN